MFWNRTFMWLITAGMLIVVAGACGVKAVTPSGTTGGTSDSGQAAGGPKAVLGEKDLNETAFQHTVEDEKNTAEEKIPEVDMSASSFKPVEPGSEDQEADPETILREPSRFASGTVTVRGVFQGWRGPCRSGPPVSRNDWMIGGTSGCLYVHGPVPSGLDPARPSNKKISVTGTVRIKNGIPYLDTGP